MTEIERLTAERDEHAIAAKGALEWVEQLTPSMDALRAEVARLTALAMHRWEMLQRQEHDDAVNLLDAERWRSLTWWSVAPNAPDGARVWNTQIPALSDDLYADIDAMRGEETNDDND